MKEQTTPYIVQTVSHALDLLEEFRDCGEELGLTELSNRLKLHKNNIFRLVATLKARNYIEQNDATGKYRLGIRNFELGQATVRQTGFVRLARPILERLNRLCCETCYVSIIREQNIYYLDGVESALPVRVVPRIGTRQPLHCTAAGKAQIAFMGGEELLYLFRSSELQPFTRRTTTNLSVLQEELHQVSLQGYAIEDEELEVGVKGIAVPVLDYNRQIVGALSISGPAERLTAERLETTLIPLALQGGAELSAKLGFTRLQRGDDAIRRAS